MHIGTDFPVILFSVILLWRIRENDGGKTSIVTQEEGLSLRGIAAITVLLHHLTPLTKDGVLLRFFFSEAGSLAVALFFFLSGYGLQKQYLKNREFYRKSFLRRRIPTVIIPLTLFTVLYWLVYFALGRTYTINDLLYGIRVGIPFVAHSWYLITILLFYLFFWILMIVFRGHVHWMPVIACGWYFLYAMICIKLKYLSHWYDTAHLLPVGMFCAAYEKKILNALKNKRFHVVFLITSLLCWLFVTYFYHCSLLNLPSYILLSLIRVFIFVVMFILLQLKISTDNPILHYLGKISLEIYLIHGLIFYLLRGDYCYLTNEPLFCFLSLSGVILIASILSPIDRFLVRSWKQAVK